MSLRRKGAMPIFLALAATLSPRPLAAQAVRPAMEEFRVEIKSSDQDGECKGPRKWRVTIKACPIDDFVGESICVTPKFGMDELKELRDRKGWMANLEKLLLYGAKVRDSVLGAPRDGPSFQTALVSSFALAREKGRGLRFVVELKADTTDDDVISPAELPIELIRPEIKHLPDFPATGFDLTVSRTLEPPRSVPQEVVYPVRMLVVAASPKNESVTEAKKSIEAIKGALENLAFNGGRALKNGSVEVVFCKPPTLAKFQELLGDRTKAWHIIHFVGHGGFTPTEDDPTPQAHLLFERPGGDRQFVGARDFAAAFQNHPELRLVVLTACSSAAAKPAQTGRSLYPASAFDGVAHHLLRLPGVTAVVAMQFDFEVEAASIFTREFYTALLKDQQDVDLAVAQARQQLALSFGHNTGIWITPSLYSRCRNGRVFEFRERLGLGGSVIDALTRKPLAGVKLTLPELKDLDGNTPTAFTDQAGQFRFDNLPPLPEIQTRLRAEKDGYEVTTSDPTLGNMSQSFKMSRLSPETK
jgi:hypothetical protein